MSKPLISVILTAYNDAEYLPKSINALLHQTLQNIEIIAIDDASTDTSKEVMEKAKELYDEHGTGFVDHIDEVVAGAVKDAVAGAASGFFSNLWESTKSFLKNLVA